MVSTVNSSAHFSNYNNGAQAETSQDYTIPPDLFTVSDTTDKRVEVDVMDAVLNNLFDKSKRAFIRFHTNKLVNNHMLCTNFESYKRKLRLEGKSPQEIFAFIQMPNGDHGEEDELCGYGVRVGMNYRGELADASKGVYLSRFADTCTPCPFINDQCLRILICKVLLGKTRRIKPSKGNNNANISPDPNYNSYTALTPDVLRPETSTPQERYINSLIYVYEYVDKDTTADRPASIFPLSIAEIQCNKPGTDFLNILVPRNNSSIVWTGTLQLQRHVLKHVTMHSHFGAVGRPRGMDILQFKTTVPYDTVVNSLPIMRLLEPEMTSALLQQPEIVLDDQQNPMYVQYFVLQSSDCEDFDNLCTLMRKFELVGVNKLPSGTHLFLIPNGGLSAKLGLCLFNTASFHCISVSARPSNQANNNWQQDIFVNKSTEPPKSSTINMSMLASRFRRTPLPVANVMPVVPHNIVPPMHFSVPPPNFNVPPPKIQSPSVPKFFPAPVSHRLSSSSTGSNDNYNVGAMGRAQNFVPYFPDPTLFNTNAMSNQVHQEPPRKQNVLDPRLASSKGHDPRRPNVPHASAVNNNKEQFQSIASVPPSQAKKQSMQHNEKWNDSGKNERKRRSPSLDDRLEIDEESSSFGRQPEDSLNNRKRSANFGNGEDIDLRDQFNGQTASKASLPPPKLVNLPTTLNSNRSSTNQSRSSRFGVQVSQFGSPGLVNPNNLNTNQYATPPPLFPPKIIEKSAVSSTTHEQIVVIPDPDLIILPDLTPEQLRKIFTLARMNNEKADSPKILFKWHNCINDELTKQVDSASVNSPVANRAQKIKNLLAEFSKLVELTNPHLCDKGARGVQKNLICSMNMKRLHASAQLIFLSTAVTQNSSQAPNFTCNDIELKSPDQLIQSFKSI